MLRINYPQKGFQDAVTKSLSESESVKITVNPGYKARALIEHFPHLIGDGSSAPFFATLYRQMVLLEFLTVFGESVIREGYAYRITRNLDDSVVVDFEKI